MTHGAVVRGLITFILFIVAKENRANALLNVTKTQRIRSGGVMVPASFLVATSGAKAENPEPKPKPKPFSEKLNRVIYLSDFRFNTFIKTIILEVKSKVELKTKI